MSNSCKLLFINKISVLVILITNCYDDYYVVSLLSHVILIHVQSPILICDQPYPRNTHTYLSKKYFLDNAIKKIFGIKV